MALGAAAAVEASARPPIRIAPATALRRCIADRRHAEQIRDPTMPALILSAFATPQGVKNEYLPPQNSVNVTPDTTEYTGHEVGAIALTRQLIEGSSPSAPTNGRGRQRRDD